MPLLFSLGLLRSFFGCCLDVVDELSGGGQVLCCEQPRFGCCVDDEQHVLVVLLAHAAPPKPARNASRMSVSNASMRSSCVASPALRQERATSACAGTASL